MMWNLHIRKRQLIETVSNRDLKEKIMRFKTVKADGLNVFYRECGSKEKPVMISG